MRLSPPNQVGHVLKDWQEEGEQWRLRAATGLFDPDSEPKGGNVMWRLSDEGYARVEAAVQVYLPPCQNRCPIKEDIQRTNVLISLLPHDAEKAREGILQIGDHLYERNPLFTVCGYICGLCERDCNYKVKGGSVKRRLLKRFISDTYTPYLKTKEALDVVKDKERVAVIGGGPSGLMAAWELSKKGYPVTIFESSSKLGGAVRYVPKYRLPEDVLDTAVDSLIRIAGIEVKKGLKPGSGDPFEELRKKGYRAFFVASGTPHPRPLTFGVERVEWQGVEGISYGLTMLGEAAQGVLPPDHYKGKRVVVVGGGNVAFDAARTAYRLGADVTIVCLESADKTSIDGIPADHEEIAGAVEEGIRIVYSRGVRNVIAENGKFKEINCPKCISVFDQKGFNPQFDLSNCTSVEGELLLIAIGAMWDRPFLQSGGLFDENGRLAVDPSTHQSALRENVFVGGDVRRIGLMVDAMAEGRQAAQSIDRYLRGSGLQRWRIRFDATPAPLRHSFKAEPEVRWTSPEYRSSFDMYEEGFTLDEAIKEARRCLECGPCMACKACVSVGLQPDLPVVHVDESRCSACSICVAACNYSTASLIEVPEIIEGREVGMRMVSYTDPLRCKGCGMCVSACPSKARELSPDISKMEKHKVGQEPGVVCFACKFGWGYCGALTTGVETVVPVVCIGKVDATDILHAFEKGAEGVLLLGCAKGDCHFQDGNEEAQKRVHLLHKVLQSFGIEKERVEVITDIDPEGTRITQSIRQFSDRLKTLNVAGA